MNRNVVNYFQRLSRAFLMPIALLSIASLMSGIASIFLWHDSLKAMFPFITQPGVQYFAKLLEVASSTVMNNLALLYCVSIGFGMADGDKEYAAFGTLVGYLSFLVGMGYLLSVDESVAKLFPANAITSILGIRTLNTGIFGAIFIGILSAFLHNKTHKKQLPMAISFFGGVRLVPIVTSICFILLGQVFPFIWIYVSNAINKVAYAVVNTGAFGPFIYQFGERLLIPTGLHQIWNTVIRDTVVSGVYNFPEPYGTIEGGRAAYAAYMATNYLPEGATLPEMVKFLRGGQIPITVFALPAAAYAMYKCADEDKKASVKGLLLTGAFTSIIAGITEPLEFTFLFIAPLLFVVYAIFCGLAYMIPYILGSTLGGTEGSLLGLAIFGVLRSDANYYIIIITGIIMAVIFYFLFTWWIKKYNLKTPGRSVEYEKGLEYLADEGITSEIEPKILKAKLIIKGLGGKENILSVDNCMSRLRVEIKDYLLLNEEIINSTECLGIVKTDSNNIQIIYGTTVGMIKNAVVKEMNK